MKRLLFIMIALAGFFLAVPAQIQAQTSELRVSVTNTCNEALFGASVLVVGTTNGAPTDWNGEASIKCPADAIIRISYIGYETQTLYRMGRSRIDVTMVETYYEIPPIIVTPDD